MDIPMDLRVSFDTNFSFGSQSLPCSSSSGSFSSESTTSSSQDPFTPISGRSTPGLQPILMDHDGMVCGTSTSFCLTPPASAFSGYFPPDTKSKAPHYLDYDSLSATPSRKASIQSTAMDFECIPMMPTPAATRNNSIQSTNPRSLTHHSFDEHMISPQLDFTQPSYTLDNSTYDVAPSWSWPGDSPVNFFEMHNSSGVPTPLQDMSIREAHFPHSPFFPAHERRRLYVDGVQQKTTALHQAQQGYRISKRNRPQKTAVIGKKSVVIFAKGSHRCPHDSCVDKKPFKRQEHLKRHLNTVHGNQEEINTKCVFCDKVFNRKDNWRSHLALHAKKPPSGRTYYHEDAQALLDEEMRKTKQRNQPKKRSLLKQDEE